MAQIRHDRRELDVKIVYYGPALSGKTTNLKRLHVELEAESKGALLSLDTREDRTLFFDLLPLDLGTVRGLRIRLRIYTVPGQVQYAATRRLVLSGADGVVLVLDSDPARQADNAAAFQDLRKNLAANSLDPDATPLVVQWNKRDLPDALPLPLLRRCLPVTGADEIGAVATAGRGVLPAFGRVVELALLRLAARPGARDLARTAADLRRRIATSSGRTPGQHVVLHPDGQEMEEAMLSSAVLGTVATAERAAALEEDRNAAERQRDELRTLAAISEALLGSDLEEALGRALDLSLPIVGAHAGSLLLVRGDQLVERAVVGASRDPLAGRGGSASSALWAALVAREAIYGEDLEQEVTFCPVVADDTFYRSGVFARVGPVDRPAGVLCFYATGEARPVRREAIPFLTLLASHVGQALEQRRLQAAVETSRRAWVATVDAMEDALYVVGDDFRLKRVNHAFARISGLSPRSLVGKKCHAVLFSRATPCDQCFVRRAFELPVGASARPVEIEGYLPERTVLARATALPPEAGDAHPVLATLHDVTQRKTLARHLAESERLASLGSMAAGIAHEINNPLAAVGGNVDHVRRRLAEGTPLAADERAALGAALADGHRSVERVRRIVADMNRCAALESAAATEMDALEVLRSSAAIARDECARPGIRLRILGSRGIRIVAPPVRLGQAIRCIVKNAIEACPEGGQVDAGVSLDPVQERVRFAVRDTGPGVPAEIARRIFEPFFTTKRPGPHTGLSLAIARGAIASMGGTLELAPTGAGAEFVIRLPAAAAEPARSDVLPWRPSARPAEVA